MRYFSLTENITKFLTVKPDKHDKAGNLKVFFGIRVLMIFWVCFGHTIMMLPNVATNLMQIAWFFKSKTLLFTEIAVYAVDIFFFMGGFFSGFVLVKKLEKIKSVFGFLPAYLVVIFHRYFRIIPAYAVALFFEW